MTEHHYYCLTFAESVPSGPPLYFSTYQAYEHQQAPLTRIEEARTEAGAPASATLESSSYLGLMTPERFNGITTDSL